MKIGVVSDTHGYFDPRLTQLLAGVDTILHAGDVGSDEVLAQLQAIAPVKAVRGNVDPGSFNLPPTLTATFEGIRMQVLHQLPAPQSELRSWSDGALLGRMHPERREAFLRNFDDSTRVIIFGHSHQPFLQTIGHRLFFNPGSAGKQRFSLPRAFGILDVYPRGVWGTLVSLGRYNEKLPGKIWLAIRGE
jgi:putative phosphoesterase